MSKHVVLTRKAAMTLGALHGFLKPKLAQDAKLNLVPILAKLTSKNFTEQKPVILKGLKGALDGKLAKDASVEGLATLLDALESEKAMDDPLPLETEPSAGLPPEDKSMDDDPVAGGPDRGVHDQIRAFLKDKLSPEDMAAVEQLIGSETADAEIGSEEASEKGEDEDMDDKDKKAATDEPPPFKGKPEVGGGVTKDAMDKAVKDAVKLAHDQATATQRGIRDAERFVRPWVGDVALTCDSADAVYATALKAHGVDVKGIHPSAYKALLERVPLPGAKTPSIDPSSLASDSSMSDFAKRYPEVARIKTY